MVHRIYDVFGVVDNTPGYIYLYADNRVATRAPSDPEIYGIILDTLKRYQDILVISPELMLEMIKPKLTDIVMSNIALTAPEHVWDRYLMPVLMMADMNVKVFARESN